MQGGSRRTRQRARGRSLRFCSPDSQMVRFSDDRRIHGEGVSGDPLLHRGGVSSWASPFGRTFDFRWQKNPDASGGNSLPMMSMIGALLLSETTTRGLLMAIWDSGPGTIQCLVLTGGVFWQGSMATIEWRIRHHLSGERKVDGDQMKSQTKWRWCHGIGT